jgi:hypothetical protein
MKIAAEFISTRTVGDFKKGTFVYLKDDRMCRVDTFCEQLNFIPLSEEEKNVCERIAPVDISDSVRIEELSAEIKKLRLLVEKMVNLLEMDVDDGK